MGVGAIRSIRTYGTLALSHELCLSLGMEIEWLIYSHLCALSNEYRIQWGLCVAIGYPESNPGKYMLP